MLGAIAGDVIGSAYEAHPIKYADFPLFGRHSHFTDDTVLTIATAYSILEKCDYATAFKTFGRRHPGAGYGSSFYQWIFSPEGRPYNSWGNGSAMRVSPIGFAFNSIEAVLEEAERSASVTHNHPEGIKGAQATALSVFFARKGENKDFIKSETEKRFNYNLNRTLDDIRPAYGFDVSSQGSVPESIIAFLESKDFEDAVRKAVSLGGDSDTMACIAGGIAHAFYREIPENIVANVRERLPVEFMEIIDRFMEMYGL
jgi:ADP-ribosylglycohydrolase